MSLTHTYHRNVQIDGLNIFYREAGTPGNPVLLLLHGYPSSSFMYRDLIANLADQFHLIAPDYPGFGNSDTPAIDQFAYTFDHLAEITEKFVETLGLTRFSLYVQDYGSPVGFRIASHHPEWIESIIVQNANAYEEGFTDAWGAFRALWADRKAETEAAVRSFFSPDITRFFYTQGVRDLTALSPDSWTLDQIYLDRPANQAAQLELFYDYRNNPAHYPEWHAYFRTHSPRTLIVWGENDPFFNVDGAKAFLRDLPGAELHLLNTGHFALEEDGDQIAAHIRRFLSETTTR